MSGGGGAANPCRPTNASIRPCEPQLRGQHARPLLLLDRLDSPPNHRRVRPLRRQLRQQPRPISHRLARLVRLRGGPSDSRGDGPLNANFTILRPEGLEAEGLVARIPDPEDRRALRVRLTTAGRRAFRLMASEHEGWIVDLFAGLESEQRAMLSDLLGRLKLHIRAKED